MFGSEASIDINKADERSGRIFTKDTTQGKRPTRQESVNRPMSQDLWIPCEPRIHRLQRLLEALAEPQEAK